MEENFRKFCGLWLFAKVFSAKFGGVVSFSAAQARAIRESFLRENRIFHQSAKLFSLESFPLYPSSCMKVYLKKMKTGIATSSEFGSTEDCGDMHVWAKHYKCH